MTAEDNVFFPANAFNLAKASLFGSTSITSIGTFLPFVSWRPTCARRKLSTATPKEESANSGSLTFFELDRDGQFPKEKLYAIMGAEIGLGVPISAALFTEYCTDSFAFAEFHCGALEILVDLKRHDLMLGITSNGEARIQIGNIRALGLDHLIHEILISELEGVRKPDILIFERAAQRLGVDPAECLFVGDNLAADILGAKQAGMKSVWFRPDPVPVPINSGPLRPDYCISRLEEVLTIYKSLKMNY